MPLPLEPHSDYTTIAHLVSPPQAPPSSRSHDPSNNLKRTDPFQFGSRYLEQGDDVYEFNAWDHVPADPEYLSYADTQYSKQRADPVSDFDRNRFNADPAKWWNLFYKNNTSNFFKDRKWLRQEFPVLADVTKAGAGRKVVLEVGAGAGNTAFPLLRGNENEGLRVHACDFSKKAVEVMRGSEMFDEKYMAADVWDVAAEGEGSLPPGLEEGSVDVVVLIFIFSALAPEQWVKALRNIYRVLKPGGDILFRDYGRGDLAQVRFKKGRWMGENFYVRGDGTRVYFFDKDELSDIWGKWTPSSTEVATRQAQDGEEAKADEGQGESAPPTQGEPAPEDGSSTTTEEPGFEILDLAVDRRLIVNRQQKLKMYRCWMQGRFRKRVPADPQEAGDR
ncbi:hypothetical protein FQN54_003741 [Arachnomyces sp. PD_36]|nr:hypothetical protein FQN54_003741 [Arachnomyces sp. PD_36]